MHEDIMQKDQIHMRSSHLCHNESAEDICVRSGRWVCYLQEFVHLSCGRLICSSRVFPRAYACAPLYPNPSTFKIHVDEKGLVP